MCFPRPSLKVLLQKLKTDISTNKTKAILQSKKSTDKQIDHSVVKWPTLTMWKPLFDPKVRKPIWIFAATIPLNLDLFKLPSKVGSPLHVSVCKYYQFQEETENCDIDKDSVVTQIAWWPSL